VVVFKSEKMWANRTAEPVLQKDEWISETIAEKYPPGTTPNNTSCFAKLAKIDAITSETIVLRVLLV
jgi:hypothetical protein